jgi:hypothetical protein
VALRLLFGAQRPAECRAPQEAPMNRRNTTKQRPRAKLAITKETLKDLTPRQDVSGGFIMKDTIIIKTSSR